MKPHSYTVFLVIFTASWVQYCASVNLTTLRLVQVIFRHGDRAPVATYPTDPYNDEDKYWPLGLGQLTTKGMDQQYDLGQYLRERYDGFIDRRYSKKQINVLSSDTDRVMMSAEANLEGLFPKLTVLSADNPMRRDELEAKVEIQLVPIHTIPAENDEIISMKADCPRREAAMEEYKESSPLLQQIRAENDDLLKYALEKTGRSGVNDIFLYTKVIDILYCEQEHGLELPSWATSTQFTSNTAGNYTVFEQMRNISAISFSLTGGTDELRRLNGGPLAKRLIDNMVATSNVDNNQQGKTQQPKMYMHSAHDDTLAAVMNTMGIFEPHNPGYASVLIFDLHQEDSTGKYFVEIFYRNTTEHDPYPMHIPGCGTPCYLEDMETALRPYIPTNWTEECHRQPGTSVKLTYSASGPDQIVVYHQDEFGSSALLYFMTMVVISITALVAILFLVSRRRRAKINDINHPGYHKGAYVNMP